MKKIIRRSILILPINNPRFVEKAYLRGADALMLDLEDSIPVPEKASARKQVQPSLPLAARSGVEVFVRINKDPSWMEEDLEASIYPGLAGVVFPKTESAEEVQLLEAVVDKLERKRDIEPGRIVFDLMIESPKGTLALSEIAGSSNRIRSLTLGPEDYCRELGVEPSADGIELQLPLSQVVTVCKAMGLKALGLLGSIGEFRDLTKFERSASRAAQLGCEGASCIHPDQVKILNRVFSPDPAKVERARSVVGAFEEGLKKGTASVSVNGKMVDIPVYQRAKVLLEQNQAIHDLEQKKLQSLRSLG
ncbi:MAG: citrate lyase beta subunit [Deltaproteobacteria bacterium]|nr:citrate lyase beta subunit [Deltaproteobacteria bacterium]